MPVIYELRGKTAGYGELGLNLYTGCSIGCRYCYDIWLHRTTWERWTNDARPRRKILLEIERDAIKMQGDPRHIIVCPAADPYQSDDAARLTRKALLILEQYKLQANVVTKGGLRSARILTSSRNHWQYGTQLLFLSEALREEWEPGGPPIAERLQALREAHAAGISTWVKIHPVAYPAELIEVVEALRADVDVWKIGNPLPGEPRIKASHGRSPGFVDADTAVAYLRRIIERGLSTRLHPADEMKVWSPDEKGKAKSGETQQDEG